MSFLISCCPPSLPRSQPVSHMHSTERGIPGIAKQKCPFSRMHNSLSEDELAKFSYAHSQTDTQLTAFIIPSRGKAPRLFVFHFTLDLMRNVLIRWMLEGYLAVDFWVRFEFKHFLEFSYWNVQLDENYFKYFIL